MDKGSIGGWIAKWPWHLRIARAGDRSTSNIPEERMMLARHEQTCSSINHTTPKGCIHGVMLPPLEGLACPSRIRPGIETATMLLAVLCSRARVRIHSRFHPKTAGAVWLVMDRPRLIVLRTLERANLPPVGVPGDQGPTGKQ